MSAASMEGNVLEPTGFMAGGKPIPYHPIWNYELEHRNNRLEKLTILKLRNPYSTYYGDLRKIMKHVFDLACAVSDELPPHEVRDFLAMMHSITHHLMSFSLDT